MYNSHDPGDSGANAKKKRGNESEKISNIRKWKRQRKKIHIWKEHMLEDCGYMKARCIEIPKI